jgi:methylenetetrahydrofolate reductase (NADPH)
MSALAATAIIAAEGVEPVLTLTTRDRNRIALLSDCLGAQALGVRNILCTSGTHQTLGAYSAAKNVFDLDSIQLTQVLANLAANGSVVGEERLGAPLGPGPLCLGGVAAPYADPLEMQVARLAKKVEAGASFLITQPVHDLPRFEQWWAAVTERGLHERVAILAGVEPLTDAETAQVEARRRPSPVIPEALLERLASGANQDAQRQLGIDVAVETVNRLSQIDGLRGFALGGEPVSALAVIARSGLVVD